VYQLHSWKKDGNVQIRILRKNNVVIYGSEWQKEYYHCVKVVGHTYIHKYLHYIIGWKLAVIEILRPLVEFITSLIATLGYPGIFILMILESALIPIPSEIIMPFSGFLVTTGKLGSIGVILAGSFGNLVGSILTYYLGIRLGRAFLIKYGKYIFFRLHHLVWMEQLFQKYGDKIAFVGRLLPGVRTYVSLPAGIGKTNLLKFAIYTLVGSIIWNSLLTYVGIQLGRNWNNIERYSVYLDIIAAIIVVGFIIWFIYNRNKAKDIRNKPKEINDNKNS
jgi:membrane protein DedA with SNARE-associated domain